jgi:hypothetical protein
MGEEYGGMEENVPVAKVRKYWGLRPWKRHSMILMVGGFLYFLIGFLSFNQPPSETRERALKVVLQVAPIQFWGCLFILAGLMSMISSRWPPISEKWGYVVLTGMSSGWASTYVLGVLFFGSPGSNWSQALLWGILSFMWWAISGLANPDQTGVNRDGRL